MDIVISWSGPQSRAVAEALKEYLPMIANAFRPWLSSADIDKGARWGSELAAALATARAGIICLTPDNLAAPYILFESGALSRTVEKSFVCTLLIGLEPSDVTGPLSDFQATKPTKGDLLQLVKTLNKALGDAALETSHIEKAFDLCWPKLEERLNNLPSGDPIHREERSERDLLVELVDLARASKIDLQGLFARIENRFEEVSERIASLEASAAQSARIASPKIAAMVDDLYSNWREAAGVKLQVSPPTPPPSVETEREDDQRPRGLVGLAHKKVK